MTARAGTGPYALYRAEGYGGIAVLLSTLTALNVLDFDAASRIGLWVMGGVAGLLTTAAVLVINRRHPYSPLLVLGLIPMALAAYWVWT